MEGERPPPGTMWRTAVTVVLGLGWFVWILVWWAFWSEDYKVAQRFAVALMSFLVLAAAAAAMWVPYSMRWAPEEDKEEWRRKGFAWRVVASTAVFAALAAFLVYALFLPWRDFSLCQSLVVIIVVVIAGAVVMSPMWMRWGAKARVSAELEVEDITEEVGREVEAAVDEAIREAKEEREG